MGVGFQGVRQTHSEQQAKAEELRQQGIRSEDPFGYDAGLAAAEGTSATSIGGDFTANLPDRISHTAQTVRPDYESTRDMVQHYGRDTAAKMAESGARERELAATMDAIDARAETLRPGAVPIGRASNVTNVIDRANREKWNKMLRNSKEAAEQAHEAKYGITRIPGVRTHLGFDDVSRLF